MTERGMREITDQEKNKGTEKDWLLTLQKIFSSSLRASEYEGQAETLIQLCPPPCDVREVQGNLTEVSD